MESIEAIEREVESLIQKLDSVKTEIHKVIIGQEQVVDELLIGLLARGHVLIEGMPGLAKTLLIKSLAEAVDLSFKRIQFTPDLMPSDIIGTEVIEEDAHGHKTFVYRKGAIFANIVLGDEINRTPPKTQAALLEVMQEHRVTYGGTDYPLPQPFFFLATQNPIEQSGTFPLPEAQMDRFLLYTLIDYPSEQEERDILSATTGKSGEAISAVLHAEDIIRLQQFVREVTIADELIDRTNLLVRNTRPQLTDSSTIKEYVAYGAGPRAGQAIILAAKGRALLQGRYAVIPDDLYAVVLPAMRHRLVPSFKAESESVTTDTIITELLKANKF